MVSFAFHDLHVNLPVFTVVVGVGDSRAETATDDGKCEVNNITPGIAGDIPVDTTVGEANGGVAAMTADAAADVCMVQMIQL